MKKSFVISRNHNGVHQINGRGELKDDEKTSQAMTSSV